MSNFPRLFAVVCIPTNTVEYSDTKYTSVRGFLDMIPAQLRDNFRLVRYDVNEHYVENTENTENKGD